MEKADLLSNLPEDVLLQILTKLPANSLVQLMSVSKFFRSLICRPEFVRTQLSFNEETSPDQSYFLSFKRRRFYISSSSFNSSKSVLTPSELPPGSEFVGHAKGAVCFLSFDRVNCLATPILWNPLMGRLRFLPPFEGINVFVSGFGFDHVNIDYKFVMIWNFTALVYGTRTGSWKRIDHTLPCLPIPNKSSVFVNGFVYWLASKSRISTQEEQNPDCIMGFDVVNEVFNVIELPPFLCSGPKLELTTSSDEKSLAMFVNTNGAISMTWGVWLMTDRSWKKQYCLMADNYFVPLKIVKEFNVLVKSIDGFLHLIVRMVSFHSDLPPSISYITRYTPSLALLDMEGLKDGGSVTRKRGRSKLERLKRQPGRKWKRIRETR